MSSSWSGPQGAPSGSRVTRSDYTTLVTYTTLATYTMVCVVLWNYGSAAVFLSNCGSCVLQYVMAVGSSVFHAMFYGELAEDQEEIRIPDVEPPSFLAMLKWVLLP